MILGRFLLLGAAACGLSACATSTPLHPTEVTRFHLGVPVDRGTVAVEPLGDAVGAAPTSLEFQAYADAVRGELARIGYTPVPQSAGARYVATVGFARASREVLSRSPFSIGLGAGGFSGGGGRRGGSGIGLGGGLGFPIGGNRTREIVATQLTVTLRRRPEGTAVWEGRAVGESDPRRPDGDTGTQAGKLAQALFAGFPGESGRTTVVK